MENKVKNMRILTVSFFLILAFIIFLIMYKPIEYCGTTLDIDVEKCMELEKVISEDIGGELNCSEATNVFNEMCLVFEKFENK